MGLKLKNNVCQNRKTVFMVFTTMTLMFMLCFGQTTFGQDTPVWTQEEIQESREGIKYEGSPATEKEQQNNTISQRSKASEPVPLEKPPSKFWQSVTNFFRQQRVRLSLL